MHTADILALLPKDLDRLKVIERYKTGSIRQEKPVKDHLLLKTNPRRVEGDKMNSAAKKQHQDGGYAHAE